MRTITGSVLDGGFLLVPASVVCAQTSLGEYGGFSPAGNTNESPLGPNLSAPHGAYPGGFPINPNTPPNSFYGSNYILPQADNSKSAYYTYGARSNQGTSYYGANYDLPLTGGQSPGTFTFGPTSGQPTSYYGANYYRYRSLPGNQFTYTGSPAGASPRASSSTPLPGVSSYTRPVSSTAVVPRNPAGRVALAASRAPITIPPGGYLTPRLR